MDCVDNYLFIFNGGFVILGYVSFKGPMIEDKFDLRG